MKIRGILLDVDTGDARGHVEDIEIEDSLEEYYRILKCDTIDIVTRKIDGKTFNIVCDDNGLFKENPRVSAVNSHGEPVLVGNLFICNNDGPVLTSLSDDDVSHILKVIGVAVRKEFGKRCAYPVLTNVEY